MKGLLRGTLVVTAGLVLLQALGWVREVILAYYFGTSSQLDALLVALTVPNFVAGTIGLAIGTAIVPVYHRWKTRDARPEGGSIAARLASIAGSVLVVTIPLALTALWGAPLLVRWIAPGFDSSTFVLAASMTRWLSVSAVPLTLSTYWAALVQADRRFEAQIAGTAVGTIVTLGGIWWLSPRLGVLGAALAFIGGALGQFAFFSVWQGYHHCLFPLSMQMGNQLARDVRELWLLMAPIIGGAALSQTRAVVDRLVASGLHTGAIASLNYAARIVNLPVILLGDGLMTVFFPNLSHQLASGNDRQSRRLLSLVYRLLVVTFVPITLLTILMAPELVELLFQRGAFDAAATSRTASLVRVYALGLLPTVTGTASMRVFHASVDTLTPVIVGLISTVINIAGNFALARPLGAQGIALATSASMALRAWMMSRALRSRLPVLVHREPFDGAQESLFRLRLLLSLAVLALGTLCFAGLRSVAASPWVILPVGTFVVGAPYAGFWWWSRDLLWREARETPERALPAPVPVREPVQAPSEAVPESARPTPVAKSEHEMRVERVGRGLQASPLARRLLRMSSIQNT